MLLTRRQFIAFSGAVLAAPPIIRARSEERSPTELTLALDASGSMFGTQGVPHWKTQISGHVFALEQKDIIDAMLDNRIHLRIIAWSEYRSPIPVVFDRSIRSYSDVAHARLALGTISLPMCGIKQCTKSTEHYWAIQQVLDLPQMGDRRVLDISTDEVPNGNYQSILESFRQTFVEQNGTINALAVEMLDYNANELKRLLCTSHGQCFIAETWSDYSRVIRQKIAAEIA